MQPLRDPGKDRAFLGVRFIADRDHKIVRFSLLKHVEHAFGFVPGNVDAVLLQDLDDARIEDARLQAGAFNLEKPFPKMNQIRLGHLAAGAVVDAYEENFCRSHDATRSRNNCAVKFDSVKFCAAGDPELPCEEDFVASDAQFDRLVYGFFVLTEEEIKIVEGTKGKSRRDDRQ